MRDTDDRAQNRSALITGLGAVTPIGVGIPAFAAGLRSGARGGRIMPFDRAPGVRAVGATCDDWDPASVMRASESVKLPRLVPMALAAAREAMRGSAALPRTTTPPGAWA